MVFRLRNAGGTSEMMRIQTDGNVGIGVTTFGTAAVKVLGLGDGTAPTTNPANMIQLYALAGELWVEDSGGTATQLSSDTQIYPKDMVVSEEFPHVSVVQQKYRGVETFVADHKMAELVQELAWAAGLLDPNEFIIKHVPLDPNEIRNWDENEEFRASVVESEIDRAEYEKGEWLAKAYEYERIRNQLIAEPNTVFSKDVNDIDLSKFVAIDPNEYRSLSPDIVMGYSIGDVNDIAELSIKASEAINKAMEIKIAEKYQKLEKPAYLKIM